MPDIRDSLLLRTAGTNRVKSEAVTLMKYDARKKSILVAYGFWWFFGWLAAHRFYLGRAGSAFAMLGIPLCFILSGLAIGRSPTVGRTQQLDSGLGVAPLGVAIFVVWWVIDALRIPGMLRSYRERLIEEIRSETASPG